MIMTDEQRLNNDKYAAQLHKIQEQLFEVFKTGDEAAQTVELDQTRMGRLSRMNALQDQAMSKERQRRRGVELQKIKAALQRIDQDEYGECIQCGKQITSARLDITPTALLCIGCANKAERC